MKTLLIATHNKGKLVELMDLLPELEFEAVTLAEIGITLDVAETGQTFAENARLKALAYSASTGLLTLADDSGLEVDALGGRPGVYTARYGGPGLTMLQRYRLLLQEMSDVPWPRRTARFCCAMALASPAGLTGEVMAACEGVIALAPAGARGFGYDPVFYVPERGMTMAELPPAVKQQISHRARAMAALKPILHKVLSL